MAAVHVARPADRRCFICNELINRTNYVLYSMKNDSKRNKIYLLEKFLSCDVPVDHSQTIYIDKKCNRVVDNIDVNLKKLQELYHDRMKTIQMAGSSPSSAGQSPVAVRPKKTAMNQGYPGCSPT